MGFRVEDLGFRAAGHCSGLYLRFWDVELQVLGSGLGGRGSQGLQVGVSNN